MATIGDLARRLEEQTYSLAGRLPEDTVESHVGGWMILARPVLRAIGYLPVGGRKEYLNASFRAVLEPLATGPRRQLPRDLRPAPRLLEIARTTGAIADILADTIRFNPRPGLVGFEAVRFEASLLASIHLTARWSRSTLNDQTLASTRHALMAVLNDLAVITEPWAMIPPAGRESALEQLRIPSATLPGLEGAVTAWADEAKDVLQQHYRVTSWAMQATAGTIALVANLTRQAVLKHGEAQGFPESEVGRLVSTLDVAEKAWRAAATWPPNLRLGGSTEDFRALTGGLREVCNSERQPSLKVMQHAFETVEPVALLHASVVRQLVDGRDLWIHGAIPGSQREYARKWIRIPEWSTAGRPLVKAASAAYQATADAFAVLRRSRERMPSTRFPLGWPPSQSQIAGAYQGHGNAASIRRGPDR